MIVDRPCSYRRISGTFPTSHLRISRWPSHDLQRHPWNIHVCHRGNFSSSPISKPPYPRVRQHWNTPVYPRTFICFLSCAYRKTSRCPSRVAAENVVLSNLQHLRTSGYPPLAEWLEIFLSIGKALFFSCIHPFEFGEQPLPCRCSWVIQWCFPKQDWSNSELHFGMLLLRTFWIRASIHRAHLRVKILGAVINYTID